MDSTRSTLKEIPKSDKNEQMDTTSLDSNERETVLTEDFENIDIEKPNQFENAKSISVESLGSYASTSEPSFSDYDSDSNTEDIHSIDYDEESIENEDDSKDKVTDNIIAFFKVKRPKRFIDTDSVTDEVSYEESEVRLILLLTFLSLILSVIASTLTVLFGFKVFRVTLTNPWNTISEDKSNHTFSNPAFQFIIMDSSGNLESLQLTSSNQLEINYNVKLPKTQSYFLFTDRGEIYIFKAKKEYDKNELGFSYFQLCKSCNHLQSVKMELTRLNIKSGQHRVIPHSELPKAFTSWKSSSLRLGDSFWIIGEYFKEDTSVSLSNSNHNNHKGINHTLNSNFWSLHKQKWFAGPVFRFEGTEWVKDFCGTSINRTNGVILNYREVHKSASTLITAVPENCIDLYIYNSLNYNLTKNSCLIRFDHTQLDHVFLSSCSSLVTKDGVMKVFYGQNEINVFIEKFHIYEIDIENNSWKEVIVPSVSEGIISSLNGRLFVFSLNTKEVFLKSFDAPENSWTQTFRTGNITEINNIVPLQN